MISGFNSIMNCARKRAYFKNMQINLFDVSLRDGLQTQNPKDWPLERKMQTFHSIVRAPYATTRIEIGSLASPKKLPIMADTVEMHNQATIYNHISDSDVEPYVLIPSLDKMQTALKYGMKHMSFISSASDSFQKKNTGKNVDQNILELTCMAEIIKYYAPLTQTRLYLSCISECPIEGQLSREHLLYRCLAHSMLDFDEIVLSDTCGTLTRYELTHIIEYLMMLRVPPSKLALHLHCDPFNKGELDSMLHYSFIKGIRSFDVSYLESTGGCSLTVPVEKMKPNMTYDIFFGALNKYIEKCLEKHP